MVISDGRRGGSLRSQAGASRPTHQDGSLRPGRLPPVPLHLSGEGQGEPQCDVGFALPSRIRVPRKAEHSVLVNRYAWACEFCLRSVGCGVRFACAGVALWFSGFAAVVDVR
jgi:hypothetical protein